MRVLVTAASKHESTTEIAEAIAKIMTREGVTAASRRPEEVTSLDGYDAVVLGSGVYAGRWIGAATEFAKRHREALLARPVWLFSSGPIGAPEPKPVEESPDALALVTDLHARGHRTFAGRLDRGRLGLAERAITRMVGAESGDFRSWPLIEAWAREIAGELKGTVSIVR